MARLLQICLLVCAIASIGYCQSDIIDGIEQEFNYLDKYLDRYKMDEDILLSTLTLAQYIRTPQEVQELAIGLSSDANKPIAVVNRRLLQKIILSFRQRADPDDNLVAKLIEYIVKQSAIVQSYFDRYKNIERKQWNEFNRYSENLQGYISDLRRITEHLFNILTKNHKYDCVSVLEKELILNIYNTFVNSVIISYVLHSHAYQMYECETGYDTSAHERYIREGYVNDVTNVYTQVDKLMKKPCL